MIPQNKIKIKSLQSTKDKKKRAVSKVSFSAPLTDIESQLKDLSLKYEELLTLQAGLQRSIENYTQLFEYAPVSYFILDNNGTIVNINTLGCKTLGLEKKQLIGKSFSGLMVSDAMRIYFDRYRDLMTAQELPVHGEFEMKGKDGKLLHALIESYTLKDEHDMSKFYFLAINDITLRKEQEQKLENSLLMEKELNEMKSQFITIASHEFRTPLATILSSAELIEKYSELLDGEKKDKHFSKIKTSVSRMREILIDFMSANEIENGRIRNAPVTFDLPEYMLQIMDEAKSFNGTHTVEFTHKDPGRMVYLDKKLFKTCMTNLMVNAYKFSPDGGRINIISSTRSCNHIVISIRDHGIGIPENEQDRIFESFFRASNASEIQGTGIGLSITRKLVSLMGGTISFRSYRNNGSTFFLKFPYRLNPSKTQNVNNQQPLIPFKFV